MSSQVRKYNALKSILNSKELSFAMECHSGLSAVIAEEAGFNCLWASGLSVSAMTGCRDRNELDTSEVCKIVEWMSDHTEVPILVDGDTGGADFNSARIFANKLVKAGAAGVCLEDKLYPKHNSFLSNRSDDLADPEVHAGKIKAIKDAEPTLVVIARLEEYIAGAGFQEAYRRALIYQEAGADAILVHSKKKTSEEIDEFMKAWNEDSVKGQRRIPIVIVPTKYYTTATDHFRQIGVSLVIWANHQMRASIRAMKDVTRKIYQDQSLVNVENEIATVSDIFDLQRDYEMQDMELRYLPSYQGTAIILSGTASSATKNVPKVLDEVRGKTVLDRQCESYNSQGVYRIAVVGGDHYDRIEKYLALNSDTKTQVVPYVSDKWATTTEVETLRAGLRKCNVSLPLFVSYGDIVFKSSVLRRMSESTADIVVAVDSDYSCQNYNEFVEGDSEYTEYSTDNDEFSILNVGTSTLAMSHVVGSCIGLVRVNTVKGLSILQSVVDSVAERDPKYRMVEVTRRLINEKSITVKGVYVNSKEWIDISSRDDLRKAGVC